MFGKGDLYLELINKLPLTSLQKQYTFMANEEFAELAKVDLSGSQRVFWHETLMRVHLTAATSILRSRRWIDATIMSVNAGNLLGFAGSFRGLIESAADTNTALIQIPATLTRDHQMIVRALEGEADAAFIVRRLEDVLIHYSHARKVSRSKLVPDSHRAQQVREYISILEKGGVERVVECYSWLCDLTHPGTSSVWMWLKAESELSSKISLDEEPQIISSFLVEYEPTSPDLYAFAFNMPIVTLKVLNYFPVPDLHTPELNQWDLSGLNAWKKIPADFFTARSHS